MVSANIGYVAAGLAEPAGASLDVLDVSHAFDLAGKQLPVLNHVTLRTGPGEFVALLGPSG